MEEEIRETAFKMPILIGSIGRATLKTKTELVEQQTDNIGEDSIETGTVSEAKETGNVLLSYVEPLWTGLPSSEVDYNFEVLKSGVIIDKLNLMMKSFWVFGRLQSCDMYMAHPTISRYHAVLQYKAVADDDRPIGFYIYDLGSSHGSFLNKIRIKPKMYVRLQVGHMLKFGCSTRTYLLTGPEADTESESNLTVTQLKAKRILDQKLREEQLVKDAADLEAARKKEETKGIDWGMGEDADEETDLSENPFAETNNEQLYIEDPKKALRGFFEREGLELHYECTERGLGQFLCSVVLPLDDVRARPIVAEALVKGKKKEAVVQCALEACRILDRHGILRQATHESRKRKAKNWEEHDYYDSDDDTFLDRTGTIERKREKRMQAKQPHQPETYHTLLDKEMELSKQIQTIEKQLSKVSRIGGCSDLNSSGTTDDIDPLDQYMTELSSNKPDKFVMGKLKIELTRLRKEHSDIVKLVNIARPAHLPQLLIQSGSSQDTPSTSATKMISKKSLPMYGKRLKVKVTLPARDTLPPPLSVQEVEPAVAVDVASDIRTRKEEEESIVVEQKRLGAQKKKIHDQMNDAAESMDIEKQFKLSAALTKMTSDIWDIGERKLRIIDKINRLADDINNIAEEIKQASLAQHNEAVEHMKEFVEKAYKQQTEIFGELEKLDSSVVDQNVIDYLKQLYNWLSDQKTLMLANLEKLKTVKFSEDPKMFQDIIEFELNSDKFVVTILKELRNIRLKHKDNTNKPYGDVVDLNKTESVEDAEKRKKKNQRRIQQRQEKADAEKKKQYEEDAQKEDYNMWVPPNNQTGDGRTTLNDKLGY